MKRPIKGQEVRIKQAGTGTLLYVKDDVARVMTAEGTVKVPASDIVLESVYQEQRAARKAKKLAEASKQFAVKKDDGAVNDLHRQFREACGKKKSKKMVGEGYSNRYTIEVSPVSARRALDILNDQFRGEYETGNGTNFYKFADGQVAYDASIEFEKHGLDIIDVSPQVYEYEDDDAPTWDRSSGEDEYDLDEGYFSQSVDKVAKDWEHRRRTGRWPGETDEKNPLSHDKDGVHVSDKDLAGRQIITYLNDKGKKVTGRVAKRSTNSPKGYFLDTGEFVSQQRVIAKESLGESFDLESVMDAYMTGGFRGLGQALGMDEHRASALYDEVAANHNLHPDDDYEEIIDIMAREALGEDVAVGEDIWGADGWNFKSKMGSMLGRPDYKGALDALALSASENPGKPISGLAYDIARQFRGVEPRQLADQYESQHGITEDQMDPARRCYEKGYNLAMQGKTLREPAQFAMKLGVQGDAEIAECVEAYERGVREGRGGQMVGEVSQELLGRAADAASAKWHGAMNSGIAAQKRRDVKGMDAALGQAKKRSRQADKFKQAELDKRFAKENDMRINDIIQNEVGNQRSVRSLHTEYRDPLGNYHIVYNAEKGLYLVKPMTKEAERAIEPSAFHTLDDAIDHAEMELQYSREDLDEVSKSMLNRYKRAARDDERRAGEQDMTWAYQNDFTGKTDHMDDWSDEDRESTIAGRRRAKKRRQGLAVAQAKTAKNGKNLGSGKMRGYSAKVRATDESVSESDDDGPFYALVLLGAHSKKRKLKFRNQEAFEKWADAQEGDYELLGFQDIDESVTEAPIERGGKEHLEYIAKKKHLERTMNHIVTGDPSRGYTQSQFNAAMQDPQKKAEYAKAKAAFSALKSPAIKSNLKHDSGPYPAGKNRYQGD